MGHRVINQELVRFWECKDEDGTALTGLSGNMSTSLTRFPTATTSESASESVAIAEIGSTGIYTFTYTPTKAYTYVLRVTESSLALEESFSDLVLDAASTAAESGAYCAEADVVGFVQMASDYTSSTTPTEARVLVFMVDRAAEIYSWMVEKVGSSAPGPTSYSTTIDTSGDAGLALSRITRMANAIGAAIDVLEASGATQAPARSERISELYALYQGLKPQIQSLVEQYAGMTSQVSNHLSEGRVTEDSFTSYTRKGFTFTGSTEW